MTDAKHVDTLPNPHACPAHGCRWPGEGPGTPAAAEHIPRVLLSHRKYAWSYDDAFIDDVLNFPGHKATCAKRPEHLPYSK